MTETATETATVTPEPILSLIFSDEFETGANTAWSLGEGWSIVPDGTGNNSVLQSSLPDQLASLALGDLNDLAVQASVQMISGSVSLELQRSAVASYRVRMTDMGTIELYRAEVLVGTAELTTFTPGNWYSLRLSAIDSVLQVSVDNVELVSYVDEAPLPPGIIAISGTAFAHPFNVDNVQVWQGSNEIPPTVTPMPEPALSMFFSESFDETRLYNWAFTTAWASSYSDSSMAVEVRVPEQPLRILNNQLSDVAIETRVQFSSGTAQLVVRQSSEDNYTASFNSTGLITLSRGNSLMGEITIAPFEVWGWYNLRLSVVGNTIRIAVNGAELLSVVDSTPLPAGTTFVSGTFVPDDLNSVLRVDQITFFVPLEAAGSISPDLNEVSESQVQGLYPSQATFEEYANWRTVNHIVISRWLYSSLREEIYIFHENGYPSKLVGNTDTAEIQPVLSPDGTRIVFASDYNSGGLPTHYELFMAYLVDEDGNEVVSPIPSSEWIQLTNTPNSGTIKNQYPTWSPDGTRIAYMTNVDGHWKINVVTAIDADKDNVGDYAPQRLTAANSSIIETNPAWSPDGRQVAYTVSGCGTDVDIYTQEVFSTPTATDCAALAQHLLVQGIGDDVRVAWSQDGVFLALEAYRGQYPNIYLRRSDGTYLLRTDLGQQVPTEEVNMTTDVSTMTLNTFPSWSPNRYLDGIAQIMFFSNDVLQPASSKQLFILDIAIAADNESVTLQNPDWHSHPLVQPGSLPGYWSEPGGGPKWSQAVRCPNVSNYSLLTEANATLETRMACLLEYRGIMFAAMFHETSENEYLSLDEITTVLPELLNATNPVLYATVLTDINDFDLLSVPYDHRYLYARSMINGMMGNLYATASPPKDPMGYFVSNYPSTVSRGNPETEPNPAWFPSLGKLCDSLFVGSTTIRAVIVPYCADRELYNELWDGIPFGAVTSTPLHDYIRGYLQIAPHMYTAVFDEVYGGVLDPVRGGSSARHANICVGSIDPNAKGSCGDQVVFRTLVADGAERLSQSYMHHLREIYRVDLQTFNPIGCLPGEDQGPLRASNIGQLAFGLSGEDAGHIHFLRFERTEDGKYKGGSLQWVTLVLQYGFGQSYIDGHLTSNPLNPSQGFEFMIPLLPSAPVGSPWCQPR